MLTTARGRIAELIAQGKSLAEVLAAAPTKDFDERYGDPASFVDRAYHSLKGAG